MPVLDGNAATRRIRTELKLQLPIVALTAGALVGERQRALDAGMDDFVSKPFDPQALIRKVRRLVEHARGEPIPMVFDDQRSASAGDGRPFMKSIDAGMVQQMFGEDLSLFRSLLARMLREYSDFALPIGVALDDEPACRLLKARCHKLKGSAGMIGATNVMRFAGAAERALHDSRPPDVVEGILRKLSAALTTLRDEATVMLDAGARQGADRGAHVDPAPPIEPADIDELCALLEAQNLAAVDKFEELSPSLRDMLDISSFDGLHDAVENLDFHLGAELLREMPRRRRSTAA
jgi:CheY-like chemotaxis protein